MLNRFGEHTRVPRHDSLAPRLYSRGCPSKDRTVEEGGAGLHSRKRGTSAKTLSSTLEIDVSKTHLRCGTEVVGRNNGASVK